MSLEYKKLLYTNMRGKVKIYAKMKSKYCKKANFFKAGTSAQDQPFRKAAFLKKLIFQKIMFRITYFFWRAIFLEQLLFQKTLPSIAATFSEELTTYFFRRVAVSQLRLLSTVTLLIHSLVIK